MLKFVLTLGFCLLAVVQAEPAEDDLYFGKPNLLEISPKPQELRAGYLDDLTTKELDETTEIIEEDDDRLSDSSTLDSDGRADKEVSEAETSTESKSGDSDSSFDSGSQESDLSSDSKDRDSDSPSDSERVNSDWSSKQELSTESSNDEALLTIQKTLVVKKVYPKQHKQEISDAVPDNFKQDLSSRENQLTGSNEKIKKSPLWESSFPSYQFVPAETSVASKWVPKKSFSLDYWLPSEASSPGQELPSKFSGGKMFDVDRFFDGKSAGTPDYGNPGRPPASIKSFGRWFGFQSEHALLDEEQALNQGSGKLFGFDRLFKKKHTETLDNGELGSFPVPLKPFGKWSEFKPEPSSPDHKKTSKWGGGKLFDFDRLFDKKHGETTPDNGNSNSLPAVLKPLGKWSKFQSKPSSPDHEKTSKWGGGDLFDFDRLFDKKNGETTPDSGKSGSPPAPLKPFKKWLGFQPEPSSPTQEQNSKWVGGKLFDVDRTFGGKQVEAPDNGNSGSLFAPLKSFGDWFGFKSEPSLPDQEQNSNSGGGNVLDSDEVSNKEIVEAADNSDSVPLAHKPFGRWLGIQSEPSLPNQDQTLESGDDKSFDFGRILKKEPAGTLNNDNSGTPPATLRIFERWFGINGKTPLDITSNGTNMNSENERVLRIMSRMGSPVEVFETFDDQEGSRSGWRSWFDAFRTSSSDSTVAPASNNTREQR